MNPWRLDWSKRAACLNMDTDLFYPDKGRSTRMAKAVCRRCPVTAQCLEWALEHNERFGVWGGLSEPERRRLNGQLRAA